MYGTNDLGSFNPNTSPMDQTIKDLILESGKPHYISIKIESGQFEIVVMYFDGKFEIVKIDTQFLGGKYILTGIGL